jgi:hypothetical protein
MLQPSGDFPAPAGNHIPLEKVILKKVKVTDSSLYISARSELEFTRN